MWNTLMAQGMVKNNRWMGPCLGFSQTDRMLESEIYPSHCWAYPDLLDGSKFLR